MPIWCFDLPRYQVSDWDTRPLNPVQEVYAALDAHCLLGLFVVMTGERALQTHYEYTKSKNDDIEDIHGVNSLNSDVWRQYLRN